MFWLLALGVSGMSYMIVDAIGGYLLIALILAPIVTLIWEIINGFNSALGLNLFMIHSWQFLSGQQTPDTIVPHCALQGATSLGGLLATILLTLLLLVNLGIGLVAIVGLPAGIIATIGGSAISLAQKDSEAARFGLAILSIALAAVVAAGLIMRFVHAGFTAAAC